MKTFQMFVRIHPNEVMQRLSSIVDQRVLTTSRPGGLIGRLNGYGFFFRRYRRFMRNSLAPVCVGSVAANGSGGSVVDVSIGLKLTLFYIFAGIFIGISLIFGLILGLVTAGVAFSMAPGDISAGGKALSLLPFLIPVLPIAFFALLYFVGKSMGSSDEAAIEKVIRETFADVMGQ